MIAGTACSDSSSSLTPTGPSGRGGSSSGAVITGRVSGSSLTAATAASTDVIAPRAGTSLRVSIAGTNISTEVDGRGQFTLTGVPPGTVTINFTGSGVSASITLTGVTADQQISLEVRLNGSNARIESENRRRDDDDDDDELDENRDEANEVEGVVTGLTGTCPMLTFMVGTRTVKTTGMTIFDDRCSQIQNMVRVEAKGFRGADGVFNAVRVEVDD